MKSKWHEVGQVKKKMIVDEKWNDHSVKDNKSHLWKYAFLYRFKYMVKSEI